MNMERAQKGLPVHMKDSNQLWDARDKRIKNAQDNMKTENPWSIETFLSEIADVEWDPKFAIIDQGEFFAHLTFNFHIQYFLCIKKVLKSYIQSQICFTKNSFTNFQRD